MTTHAPVRPSLGSRALFPTLQAKAYLNHAGISPASSPVVDAFREVPEDYAARGAAAFSRWGQKREELRAALGRLVNASPADIAFEPNTTRGVVDIALCLKWHQGERVVVFEGEFPANVTPWQQAAQLFGLEVVFKRADDFMGASGAGLAQLEETLKRGARLVATSAVQFQTGLRMPLAEMAALAHRYGAELFVDGVQAVGVVPLDVKALGIDYLACGSHKWLMGGEGAGFLYAEPERARTSLRTAVAGWFSHVEGLRFLFEGAGHLRYDRPVKRNIQFVEGGNYNSAGLNALLASVSMLEELGPANVHAHVNRYLDALEPELAARGFTSVRQKLPEQRSGILSVWPPRAQDVIALGRKLGERGVAVATPDGYLRFSPHWPNSTDELPGVLAAVDDALKG